jgi:hypothetical protein
MSLNRQFGDPQFRSVVLHYPRRKLTDTEQQPCQYTWTPVVGPSQASQRSPTTMGSPLAG